MYQSDPYAGELDKKSISFANRNPLNLRPLPAGQLWHGQTGIAKHKRAGAFCVFDTVENGYRAAAVTLVNYGRMFGRDTLRKIIAAWAPPADGNDTPAYLARVVHEAGIAPDVTLNLLSDAAGLVRIMDAMTRVESGGYQPFRLETIREGVRRAYRRFNRSVE